MGTWALLLLVFGTLAGYPAGAEEGSAGQLQFGDPTQEGTYYTIPIMLHSESSDVAAMDFRLQYDPQVFTPVSTEAGGVAVDAGKVISANATQPGEYSVVLMGLNRDTMASGEVARIVLEAGNGAYGDGSQLTIADPNMATWEGQEIPSHGESRLMQMDEENNEVEPEQPGEADEAEEESPETDPTDPNYQSPEQQRVAREAPSNTLNLNPANRGSAALDPEEYDPDEIRRMTENIARNAAEALRLRDQLPTPGEGQADWSNGELADAREVQDGGLSDQEDTHQSAQAQEPSENAGQELNDDATAEAPNASSPTTEDVETNEGRAAREARMRAKSGFQWVLIGSGLFLLIIVLAVLRRLLLN